MTKKEDLILSDEQAIYWVGRGLTPRMVEWAVLSFSRGEVAKTCGAERGIVRALARRWGIKGKNV